MINTNNKKSEEENIKTETICPIIVYALIKGNIHKIKSNINFLYLFRHRTRLESEEEIYINSMLTAIEFIENLTYKKLNIEKNEFLKKCEESENRDSPFPHKVYQKVIIDQIKNEQVIQQSANSDQSLFELELNKLYNEYFINCDIDDIPIFKLENMHKDFKIVISMIKEYKTSLKNIKSPITEIKNLNENIAINSKIKNTSNNINLIEI